MAINRAFIPILFLSLLFWWGRSTPAPFLSLFSQQIHLTTQETALFLGAMGFFRVLAQPLIGIWITTFSETKIIKSSLTLMFLSNVGMFFTSNYSLLMLCRVGEAIGVSLFMVEIRLLINSHGYQEISRLNTYYSGIKNFASFLAPAFAGWLVALSSARSIFMISAIIFVIALLLVLILPQKYFAQVKEDPDTRKSGQITLHLIGILLIHSLEFLALGLWLSGWSIYAITALEWTESQLGLSYSLSALAGIGSIPFIHLPTVERCPSHIKLIIGLSLLMFQPLISLYLAHSWLVWVGFLIGGAGATLYFSSFHTYVSSNLSRKSTATFYGFLGSSTFLAMAVGQGIAPFLWEINVSLPLYVNLFSLIIAVALYTLIIAKQRRHRANV